MTTLRRFTHLLGVAALAAVALLLMLEVTDVVGSRWRRSLADGIENGAEPAWPLWVSGLVGLALALAGMMMIAAQLAPARKGLNSMHEVYRGRDGDTRIRGRAAIRAARHELEGIDGVVDVAARVNGKTLHLELKIDDRADITDVETQARERLGTEFWINLGLADFAINILVTHHPRPPRVR